MQNEPKQDDFKKGFKLMLGGCAALLVVAVIVVGGLFMLGAIPLAFFNTKTANQNTTVLSNTTNKNSIDWTAKFEALSKEEKLQKRFDSVRGGNEGMLATGNEYTKGAHSALTGTNQDVMTITIPLLRDASNAFAGSFAAGIFSSFMDDKQMLEGMIALEFASITVTDGKRTWTKVLKTGELIEQGIK